MLTNNKEVLLNELDEARVFESNYLDSRFLFREEHFGAALYDRHQSKYFFLSSNLYTKLLDKSSVYSDEELKSINENSLVDIFNHDNFPIFSNFEQSNLSLSAPLRVYIDTTYDCNLSCNFCYNNLDRKDAKKMSLDNYDSLFSQMKDNGVFKLSIAGGEPFADSKIFSVIEKARSYGLTVSMTSNGTIVNNRILKNLNKCGIKRLTISLDSANPKVAEARRPGLKFDKFVSNLSELGKVGIDISLKCTFGLDFKEGEMIELVKFAESVDSVSSLKFNFERDLSENPSVPSEEQVIRYFEIFELIQKYKAKSNIKIIVNQTNPVIVPDGVMSNEIGIGCPAGRDLLYINPYGEVKGCAMLDESSIAGNILSESLLNIWTRSSELLELRNRDINDKCKDCEYLFSCRGGCSQRRIISGDLNNADYYCFRDVASKFSVRETTEISSKLIEEYSLSHL